jgi:hypothetical protein
MTEILGEFRNNCASTSKRFESNGAEEMPSEVAPRSGGTAVPVHVTVHHLTGLFVIAIAIPALLWLTWRPERRGARDDSHLSFRDWDAGELDTSTGSVKGAVKPQLEFCAPEDRSLGIGRRNSCGTSRHQRVSIITKMGAGGASSLIG